MPIYAYRCASCGHAKDVLQKMSDPPLTRVPGVRRSAFIKQVTAAGFQLKGSGWYVTDFRGGDKKPDAGDADGEAADGEPTPTAAQAGRQADGRATQRRCRKQPARRAERRPPRRPAPAPAAAPPCRQAARLTTRRCTRCAKYLLAGLLVWCRWPSRSGCCSAVLGLLDGVFAWLLAGRRPCCPSGSARCIELLRSMPGLGVLLMLVVLLLTGVVRHQLLRPVAGCAWGTGCSAASRSSSRSTARSSRSRDTLFSEQRQRVPQGGAGAVPARRLAGPSPSSPARPAARSANHLPRRLRQRLRADHAQPDLRLFPDDAAQPTWSSWR